MGKGLQKKPAAGSFKDSRKTFSQRVRGKRGAGAPIQYHDGLTKMQRSRLRKSLQGKSTATARKEPLVECVCVGGTLTRTQAATGSQLRAVYGDEPPQTLVELALPTAELQILLDLFGKVNEAIRDSGMKYCMVGGGLLGYARGGGHLPWDDDLDLGITEEDVGAFRDINFASYGLVCSPPDAGLFKLTFSVDLPGTIHLPSHLNGRSFNRLKGKWPFVDVFVFAKSSGTYRYLKPKWRAVWKKERLPCSFETRDVKYKMGGRKIHTRVPVDVERYVTDSYGHARASEACLPNFNHRTDRMDWRSVKQRAARYKVGGHYKFLT